MKKNLALLLLTSILVCCTLGLVACQTSIHTHSIEKVEAKAATCETAGNIEYYRCDGCDKLFSDESYTETTLEETIIADLGHDEESHDAKAATCTEDGWDAYVTCKRDGCDYTTKVVIPALDHDCDSEVTTQPTCTEKGVRTYTCKRTGCEHTYTEDVNALGHDNKGSIAHKDATCTAAGVEGGTYCTRCNDGKAAAEKTINAIAHANKVHHVKVDATCTEAGTIEYWSCPDCNKNYSDEACTKVVTELTIAALDHDMQPVAKKDATCTETGYDAYEQCSRCDHNTKGNDIPAIAHANKVHHEKVNATCTETGTIEYWSCPDCNKNYSDEACTKVVTELTIAALDHDYDNGTITTKPTVTTKGVKKFTCKREGCGHTYTADVDAYGYDATLSGAKTTVEFENLKDYDAVIRADFIAAYGLAQGQFKVDDTNTASGGKAICGFIVGSVFRINLNVTTDGWYKMTFVGANDTDYPISNLTIELDGTTLSPSGNLQGTAHDGIPSYWDWKSVELFKRELTSGSHVLTITVKSGNPNFDCVVIEPTPAETVVEFETLPESDYDVVTRADFMAAYGLEQGQFKVDDTATASNGKAICGFLANSTFRIKFNVTTAGSYKIILVGADGGSYPVSNLTIELDGTTLSPSGNLQGTGYAGVPSYWDWQSIEVSNGELAVGEHVLTITVKAGNPNLDCVRIVAAD